MRMHPFLRTGSSLALFIGLVACGATGPAGSQGSVATTLGTPTGTGAPASVNPIAAAGPADTSTTLNYFGGMKTGPAQFQALCSRGYADKFSKAYCAASTPPSITSLKDLLGLVGIAGKFAGGPINFALNSQNGSLVSRSTSVLNPRAIMYDSTAPFIAFGFARGDGVVEIAAEDQNSNDINFFLVHYQHACDVGDTCDNGDRFLAGNESGWGTLDVYSGHDDLVNTPRQCDTCHRPQGFDYTANTGSKAILRMQELVNPWTHWFCGNRGGSGAVTTFCGAHSDDYAAIPNAMICGNNALNCQGGQTNVGTPPAMQTQLIQAHNFQKNPDVIVYSGNQINNDKATFVGPPNATWKGFFQQVLDGNIIHVPHYEISPFDANAVAKAAASYKAAATGAAASSSVPDITADALLQPSAIEILGHTAITANPNTGMPATAVEVVNQMCATCHRGAFPGSGNRENFKVSDFPSGLSPEEALKVANRICRPASSIYLMPPVMYGVLDPNAQNLILTALGMPTPCPPVP